MEDAIAAVRSFNRFYTLLVGALEPAFLGSDLSLAEARLLFEVANADRPLATDLQGALGMDAGYVSRVLRRFESAGWITRPRSKGDARRRPIVLTDAGRTAFAEIDRRQRDKMAEVLTPLGAAGQRELVAALGTAHRLLTPGLRADVHLRPFRVGDMGLIVTRQALLYDDMYGWGRAIEAIEGEVTSAFLRGFKPGREQCWVAEACGVMAGSVIITDEGGGCARLRLLYVEPFAQGFGLGTKLVSTCVGFAREVGYAEMTLWTHTVLERARRVYAAHGFKLVETKTHEDFGVPVQGETWHLNLRAAAGDDGPYDDGEGALTLPASQASH